MSLIPYVREFDRALDRWIDGPLGWEARVHRASPVMDAYSDEDGLVVRFEVPGVSPESLSIETRGRTLQVRSAAPEGEEGVERRHEFARAFSLPADVDPERAEAECRLGVLTIRVPKAESEKPRRVEVKIH